MGIIQLITIITIIMFSSVSVLLVCAGSLLAQDCPLPPPSVCTNGDITCDMGVGSDGCWLGDYCMPAGSVCPPPTTACFMPPPSTCADGVILCDMGVDTDGCWMGDYCMPAGSECPPPVTTTECVPPPPAGPCAEEGELLFPWALMTMVATWETSASSVTRSLASVQNIRSSCHFTTLLISILSYKYTECRQK